MPEETPVQTEAVPATAETAATTEVPAEVPVETPVEPQKPSELDLSAKCLNLVQRLNGQIHGLTQGQAAGDDAALEKQVCRRTLDQLEAACKAAGI